MERYRLIFNDMMQVLFNDNEPRSSSRSKWCIMHEINAWIAVLFPLQIKCGANVLFRFTVKKLVSHLLGGWFVAKKK